MNDLFLQDPQISGAKGLVFIGDAILVYRRDNQTRLFPLKLDLPGSGAEAGETVFETFCREVKEEFGLTILSENVTYCRKYPSSVSPEKNAYFLVACLPRPAEKNIRFGNEGLEYMLMAPEEFIRRTDAWPVLQARTAEYLRLAEET